jgi:glycosyltransferase involved in cell wall biosynthesis
LRLRRRKPPYLADSTDQTEDFPEVLATLPERPLISVAMPTYNTHPGYLAEAIESVCAQRYSEWELCIVDDGSTRSATRRALKRFASRDPRIKVEMRSENGGISAATNAALAMSRGEIVAFLDHDDVVTPDALLWVAQAFNEHDIDAFYSDQDKITPDGVRADPFLKPDWSPVYALGAMYVGHLLAVRRSIAEEVGGFDPGFDTIQDFEFMLRVSERSDRIFHHPHILYHWRAIPASIASDPGAKSGVEELQTRAVTAHLRRRGVKARAIPHPSIPHRTRLVAEPRTSSPKVSVVIAAGGRPGRVDRCLDSLSRTTHPIHEVIVVDPPGPQNGEGAGAGRPGVMALTDPGATFSPARARNLGARAASGDYVAFLSDAAEVVAADWLDQLLVHAELPQVGAVGSVLERPRGIVDAAGASIGMLDPALSLMQGFRARADGYYGSLVCAREVSAITSDCMLIGRTLFTEAGGFNEGYARQYEDIDLCLQLWSRGHSVVCVPTSGIVLHDTDAERRTATDIVDRALFVDSWYEQLLQPDRFYNEHFSRDHGDYTLDEDSFLPEPLVSTWMAA